MYLYMFEGNYKQIVFFVTLTQRNVLYNKNELLTPSKIHDRAIFLFYLAASLFLGLR